MNAEKAAIGRTSPDTGPIDEKGLHDHNGSVPVVPEAGQAVDISFSSIIKGTASKPMTVFERKAALVNAEMDKFGMGRYQWCIWFLCGFGYFLDLAWAQGVGVLASAVYQEMGVASTHWGDIFSCSNAGLAVGALFWGIMVDIIGRKWAFNLTCLITSVFGMLLVRSTLPTAGVHADASSRPHRSTTTQLSALSICFLRLDLVEISQSMLPLRWNICRRTDAIWSHFFRSGNHLGSLLRRPLLGARLPNIVAMLIYHLVETSQMVRRAAQSPATWAGDMR